MTERQMLHLNLAAEAILDLVDGMGGDEQEIDRGHAIASVLQAIAAGGEGWRLLPHDVARRAFDEAVMSPAQASQYDQWVTGLAKGALTREDVRRKIEAALGPALYDGYYDDWLRDVEDAAAAWVSGRHAASDVRKEHHS